MTQAWKSFEYKISLYKSVHFFVRFFCRSRVLFLSLLCAFFRSLIFFRSSIVRSEGVHRVSIMICHFRISGLLVAFASSFFVFFARFFARWPSLLQFRQNFLPLLSVTSRSETATASSFANEMVFI